MSGKVHFYYRLGRRIMKNMAEARRAEEVQPVRTWTTFALPKGQVVYKGRYYFAWCGGRFIGAYDSLDDAVNSVAFRNEKTH
jgi:hypothetical protein